MADKYSQVIVDTGGRDTTSQRAALTVADVVLLVPFVPRSFDVWTLEKVSGLVAEMRAVNPALRAYAQLSHGLQLRQKT